MDKKNIVMIALCVAIAGFAIAYAAFATTLNVNGTVNASGTFAVTFTAPGSSACVATTQVGTDTPSGTVTATAGSTTAVFTTNLYTPGDVVTCTIPVKNTGNLRAKYVSSSISPTTITGTSTPISVTVSSSTGTNAIAANGTSSIVVVIRYNWSGTSQPADTDLTKTFTISSSYTQAI